MSEAKKPSQHILALVTYFVLVPLVYFIPDFVGQYVPGNKLLNVVIAVGIIVPIVSYVVMPIALKMFSLK